MEAGKLITKCHVPYGPPYSLINKLAIDQLPGGLIAGVEQCSAITRSCAASSSPFQTASFSTPNRVAHLTAMIFLTLISCPFCSSMDEVSSIQITKVVKVKVLNSFGA